MPQLEYPKPEADERALIESHMEFAREVMIHKVEGLAAELGAKRLGGTRTSVLGVLKHLTFVEMGWFQYTVAGLDIEAPDDWESLFDVEPGETAEALLQSYKEACAKSREICAGLGLDDDTARPNFDGTQPTLRWVYLHMIDETARHNGHLDIYRELLDGAVDSNY